jgi:hypothetical protein
VQEGKEQEVEDEKISCGFARGRLYLQKFKL